MFDDSLVGISKKMRKKGTDDQRVEGFSSEGKIGECAFSFLVLAFVWSGRLGEELGNEKIQGEVNKWFLK